MQIFGLIFIFLFVVALLPVFLELFIAIFIAVIVGVTTIVGGVLIAFAGICTIVLDKLERKGLRRQVLSGIAGGIVLLTIVLLAYLSRVR